MRSIARISVVGLGKLGLPIAAGFAAKGFVVTGVDENAATLEAVRQGVAPGFEPGLVDLLRRASPRLRVTADHAEAVQASDATFLLVPTPSTPAGDFALDFVERACGQIGRAMAGKADYHLVVLASTVSPGSTEGRIVPELAQASGKSLGRDFGVCYCPEFFALGAVIRGFYRPDLVLIGESDKRAGELLVDVYRRTCENQPQFFRTSFVNAELAKLAVNTYVGTKIAYANMLALMCSRLPGADVDVVTAIMGADSRIGDRYLKGGLGFGGPCFPRDQRALVHLGRAIETPAALAEATDRANRDQLGLVCEIVRAKSPPGGVVAVLGLTFKPGTNVVESSQSLAIARDLALAGLAVRAYDPQVTDAARAALPEAVVLCGSLGECVRGADVVVLATPWPELVRDLPGSLESPGRLPMVIDCWRALDPGQLVGKAEYLPFGVGPDAPDG